MSTWINVPEDFIIIDTPACTGCGCCLTICGGDVFEINGGKAVAVNADKCLECGTCEVVCPAGAITFNIPAGGTGIVYECG
jgi:NAD-dependent dihydropyrimidine dehydrogenase PreA subunit